jgi:intracellular sulfur oxidation DsrE/DsrF family protein
MKTTILIIALFLSAGSICLAQTPDAGDPGQSVRDSLAHVKMVKDSVRLEKLLSIAMYPLIKGGKWSGVIPVADPTEIPDNTHDYKLLFEMTAKNPDSLSDKINFSLDEVARLLNLHVASGIPAEKIIPVVVIHGPGLEAVWNNEAYQRKHSMDNPNLGIVRELEKVGVKFIVCGQAMAFFGTEKEDLLPEIKITLTAQTVLSNYQSKGYVLFPIEPDR